MIEAVAREEASRLPERPNASLQRMKRLRRATWLFSSAFAAAARKGFFFENRDFLPVPVALWHSSITKSPTCIGVF
jgi:hypothetical protein